ISGQYSPSHLYTIAGTYDVRLVIVDTTTCNVSDTASHIVEIYKMPIAGFLFTTDTFKYEIPVQFTSNSIYYTQLAWSFGDGATSDETNPLHTYESIGPKDICIIASNPTCADTMCKNIFIEFIPLIGVPNAFSPNGDGINDVIKVEGRGIVEMVFRIFNRWGEKVFETNDVNQGWNGIYKGDLQEMDVFTYTVEATLINGQVVPLKGNITLLR
ncbi:MAG: cell surface protein, partial [Bacteroidota bacterium]|nr:cell surface protein [Bacteroidota bacterium]